MYSRPSSNSSYVGFVVRRDARSRTRGAVRTFCWRRRRMDDLGTSIARITPLADAVVDAATA
jgi:hypothetical protein